MSTRTEPEDLDLAEDGGVDDADADAVEEALDAEDGPAGSADTADPDAERRPDRWPALITALAGVFLVLAVTAGVLGSMVAAADDRADRRAAAVATAEEVATGMLELDFRNSPETIDRMLAVSTGPLREQLTALSATLTSLLDQGQVSSDGTITAAGIETIDDTSAQVLLAAQATVRNAELPDGQLRTYKMVVTVQRDGDRWLASAVDFVA